MKHNFIKKKHKIYNIINITRHYTTINFPSTQHTYLSAKASEANALKANTKTRARLIIFISFSTNTHTLFHSFFSPRLRSWASDEKVPNSVVRLMDKITGAFIFVSDSAQKALRCVHMLENVRVHLFQFYFRKF